MEENVYIGKKECGCTVVIVSDDPKYKKDTADTVAEMIRDGLTVERTSQKEGLELFGRCNCGLAGRI